MIAPVLVFVSHLHEQCFMLWVVGGVGDFSAALYLSTQLPVASDLTQTDAQCRGKPETNKNKVDIINTIKSSN